MATVTWEKGKGNVTSANWSSTDNWDSGAVPQDGDDVVMPTIQGTTAYTITLDVNTANLNSITIAAPKAADPTVTTLAINGFTLNVTATGSSAINMIGAGHITMAGGTINDSGGLAISPLSDLIGWGMLNLSGHYTGTGTLQASGGTLDVFGTVDSGVVLSIDSATSSTLKIENGATSAAAISITNGNQTLEIGSSGNLTINAAQNVTLGTIKLDGGTLTDSSGITIGNSANLTGRGTVAADLAGTGTISANGGTLDVTGSIASGSTLAIATVAGSVLKIDGVAVTGNAISISDLHQTLEVGTAGSLTIGSVESITNGTIQLDGGSLTDSSGITIGTGAHLTGQGTITAGTSSGTFFEGVGSVTASGGILDFVTRVDATTQTAFDIGSGATLKFESLVGASGVNPVVTFDSGANTLDLSLISSGAGSLDANFFGHIGGFTFGDGIKVASATNVVLDGTHTQLTVFDGASDLGTFTFTAPINVGTFTVSGGNTIELICFMPGTLISTPDGARSVETFKSGDLVFTAEGRAVPVRWVGRQTVSTRFGDPLRVLPIRIRAGALAQNVPCRDLLLSPNHAVLVDDVLIQAGALVNGVSILRERNVPERFTYYHIELDDHSLLLAENTPAETFVDNVDRLGFDNWAEHEALYPQGKPIVEMDYPRAQAYRQVPRAIRESLARRAVAQWRDAAVA